MKEAQTFLHLYSLYIHLSLGPAYLFFVKQIFFVLSYYDLTQKGRAAASSLPVRWFVRSTPIHYNAL